MTELLFVDDEEDMLLTYHDVFSNSGYRVTTADSGEKGATLVAERTFDLIVLDLMMPGLNGIELTSIIKSNILNCNTPIFMVSGNFNSDNTKLMREIGLVTLVKKPPVLHKLLDDVESKLNPQWHMVAYAPSLVELFGKVSKQILNSYLDVGLVWGKPELSKSGLAPFEYSATVALFGQTVYGSLSFCCSESIAKSLASKLFGDETVLESNEFIASIVGEIGNQLAGELRRALSKIKVETLIGLPEVNVGQTRLPLKVSSPAIHFPAKTVDGHELVVVFCLGNPKKVKLVPDPPGFEVFLYD